MTMQIAKYLTDDFKAEGWTAEGMYDEPYQ
jgi:hypothetical protein